MKRKAIPPKIRKAVRERDNYTCQYCGKKVYGSQAQVDHILAVANGGANELENYITACKVCNRAKSDKDALAYIDARAAVIARELKQLYITRGKINNEYPNA